MNRGIGFAGVLVGWVLAAGVPVAAPAALVTANEVATPDDVHLTRDVRPAVPPPFKTFIDTLSVSAPPVTLSGGDTLQFHLSLVPPYRFAISTTADTFEVGVEMRSSATGTTETHPANAPTVVLLAPDNVRSPELPYTSYEQNPVTEQVVSLITAAQFGIPPPAPVFDPTLPTTFFGFDGTLALPAGFPTTTFDAGVSLVVRGELHNGVDPPPVLAYVTSVPEPSPWMALAGMTALAARGVRRSRVRMARAAAR